MMIQRRHSRRQESTRRGGLWLLVVAAIAALSLTACTDSEEADDGEPTYDPSAEHRECEEHDECVAIYADCSMSCECAAVNDEYEDDYAIEDLDCEGSNAGICDWECMHPHLEASRCEEGSCRQVVVSYEDHDLVDRVRLDSDYTIGVAANFDESGGIEETEQGTAFELESLNGDIRIYYEPDFEPET
ncbi:MAG: hypothetical protein ACOCV2_09255, partial [Persicimonas sp.]